MSGKVCQCGEILTDREFPNELEWDIFYKNELEKYKNVKYEDFITSYDNFNYFWLCPKCKRVHLWLKSGEFRIYERINIKEDIKSSNDDGIEIYKVKEGQEIYFDNNGNELKKE